MRTVREPREPAVKGSQPEVTTERDALAKGLENHHEKINQLEDKLRSVLRSESPATSEDGKEETVLVPLADDIRGFVKLTASATARINSMIDRLEL